MEGNFDRCCALILKEEGGLVNNKHDRGKLTNRGITQATWVAWEKEHGRGLSSVAQSTVENASAIYREEFWDGISGDLLPVGVDLMVFNESVMSGCSVAIKMLQKALEVPGLKIDGHIGTQTRVALANVVGNRAYEVRVIDNIKVAQLSWLKKLTSWKFFGGGWNSRVNRQQLIAHQMVVEAK